MPSTRDILKAAKAASKPPSKTSHVCPECCKRLSRKCDLDRHMLTHAPNRADYSFTCPFEGCNMSSLQKGNVNTHMKRHMNIKDLLCPYEGCEYATGDPAALTRHKKRIHNYIPNSHASRAKAAASLSTEAPRREAYPRVPRTANLKPGFTMDDVVAIMTSGLQTVFDPALVQVAPEPEPVPVPAYQPEPAPVAAPAYPSVPVPQPIVALPLDDSFMFQQSLDTVPTGDVNADAFNTDDFCQFLQAVLSSPPDTFIPLATPLQYPSPSPSPEAVSTASYSPASPAASSSVAPSPAPSPAPSTASSSSSSSSSSGSSAYSYPSPDFPSPTDSVYSDFPTPDFNAPLVGDDFLGSQVLDSAHFPMGYPTII